jgi:spore coat protein CotH
LGALGPRTTYAYITVDTGDARDTPRGLFVAVENIDGDYAERRFGTRKAPIFKPVTYDLFQDLGDDWAAYEKIYDLKTKATPEQTQRVIDFAKLVTHATDEEFARRLPEFLDLDEFAAFLAGHVLLSSYDGFLANGQNYYVYLDPRSNKFGFVPWDQDHAWGDFGHVHTTAEREDASIWRPALYDFKFLKRVMADAAFKEIYRAKLEKALENAFSKEVLYAKIDSLAERIRPAVAAESDFRLKRFEAAVSDKWVDGPRDGPPEGPDAPTHQIKRFIENRVKSVRDQLDGKSKGHVLHGFN